LQIAIFNSCDGLGVAREFALLHIPQIILFKEPVPDPVAQTFLAYFLESFANGQSLYLSVREARERLQALENKFPCASWLPLIFQNPAETSITWQALLDGNFQQKYFEPKVKQEKTRDLLPKKSLVWLKIISSSTLSTIIITAIRLLGLLESLELQSFDWYLASKRAEQVDSRIVIVTIDEEDIKQQNIGKSSLADRALKQILEKIAPYQPRAIGLDVYRDFSSRDRDLKKNLAENQNLIAICKVSDPIHQVTGIEAPPEIPIERQGFSDFLEDEDGVVRRQLMFFNPDPASNCQASYALSLQLAFRYLLAEGIAPTYTSEGNLQLGSITIPLLKRFTGGYQNLDARGGQILLNYRQNIRPFSRISLRHFLSKDFNPEVLRDRLLLIGVTAYSNNDYWNTPWGKNPTQRQAGVLIHAHMTSQILSHVLDKRPLIWVWSFPIEIIWLSFWSLLASIFAARLVRLSRLLLGGGFLLATIYLICWLTFFQAGWLPLFPAILVVLLSLSLSKSFSFFDR
jgi:CHASE2 domain-containing sensor protein